MILISAFICQGLNKNQTSPFWPTYGWRTSTPEKQGMDSEQLVKIFDFVEENKVNIHSLLVPEMPPTAREISGKTYVAEPNDLGLISLSLLFENGKKASLRLYARDFEEENPIGLDGVYRLSNNSRFGLPEALRGHWESAREFYIECNEFANNHLFRIWIRFEGDSACMKIIEDTGLMNTTIKARAKK